MKNIIRYIIYLLIAYFLFSLLANAERHKETIPQDPFFIGEGYTSGTMQNVALYTPGIRPKANVSFPGYSGYWEKPLPRRMPEYF